MWTMTQPTYHILPIIKCPSFMIVTPLPFDLSWGFRCEGIRNCSSSTNVSFIRLPLTDAIALRVPTICLITRFNCCRIRCIMHWNIIYKDQRKLSNTYASHYLHVSSVAIMQQNGAILHIVFILVYPSSLYYCIVHVEKSLSSP